jgi:hypothetical protein
LPTTCTICAEKRRPRRASKCKHIMHVPTMHAELPGGSSNGKTSPTREASRRVSKHKHMHSRHDGCVGLQAGAATARPRRPEKCRPTERANAGTSRTADTTYARSSQGGSSNGKTSPTRAICAEKHHPAEPPITSTSHTAGMTHAEAATARPRQPEKCCPTEPANAGTSRTVGTTHTRSSAPRAGAALARCHRPARSAWRVRHLRRAVLQSPREQVEDSEDKQLRVTL